MHLVGRVELRGFLRDLPAEGKAPDCGDCYLCSAGLCGVSFTIPYRHYAVINGVLMVFPKVTLFRYFELLVAYEKFIQMTSYVGKISD